MRSLVCMLVFVSAFYAAIVPCLAQQLPLTAPDEAAVKNAQDLIKKAYAADYRALEKNSKDLVQKLLIAAGETKDPVRKYACLLSAEQAAVVGDDHGRVLELIDIRAQSFAIDRLRERITRLTEFLSPRNKPTLEAMPKLYGHAVDTAEQAMMQESFEYAREAADLAAKCAKALSSAAKAKRDTTAIADGEAKQAQAVGLDKDVERRAGLFAECQKARETLKKEKNSPAANGVIGRYLCFELGRWGTGLPFLAQGDQKELADVASLEIGSPAAAAPNSKQVFDIAGKWWEVADEKEMPRANVDVIRSHAADLYRSVAKLLNDPIDKALASQRIDTAETESTSWIALTTAGIPAMKPVIPVVVGDGCADIVGNPATHVVAQLGNKAFANRDYKWTEVPQEIDGWLYEPVTATKPSEKTLVIKQAGIVYAACVASGADKLEGLGWQKVNATLKDSGGNSFTLYKKEVSGSEVVPAGHVRAGMHVFYKRVVPPGP